MTRPGSRRGRHWSPAAARAELRRTVAAAEYGAASAPHQLRHAVEMARESVALIVIQRQLAHSKLGITSVYRKGFDVSKSSRPCQVPTAPMNPVSASRRL